MKIIAINVVKWWFGVLDRAHSAGVRGNPKLAGFILLMKNMLSKPSLYSILLTTAVLR